MGFDARDIREIADKYNSFEEESKRVMEIINDKATLGSYYVEKEISQEAINWLKANRYNVKIFNVRCGSKIKCGISW